MKTSVKIGRGIESLFGTRDENIRLLESALGVRTNLAEDALEIEGEPANVARAEQIVQDYADLVRDGHSFSGPSLYSHLKVLTEDPASTLRGLVSSGRQRNFGKKPVQPKGANQKRYVDAIENNDMVFGIGPAGTGKTYLAVAMAINALVSKKVNRIILARPAVEAGERLGFLPGTLQEKVDPYLRPLYDALYDMLEAEKVERYLEKNIIEIAPIAFMRGRTLNNSFVILDEAQNTTTEQMKMFLTRLGFDSKAVITGDITQIDLPSGKRSGLLEAIDVIAGIKGISFVYFDERDVVRHSLVQRIIRAYEAYQTGARPNGGAAINGQPADSREELPAAEPEAEHERL
jgi:phosphate starvation-inducible protein PhoH and related proteins